MRGTSGILPEIRKLNTWIQGASGGNANHVYPGYSLSGSALDTSYTDDSFTRPFGVYAMTDAVNQDWPNALWNWIASPGINANDGDFGNSVTMRCVLMLFGNWWRPVYSLRPMISNVKPLGANILISGTNGLGGLTCWTLASTSLGLPPSSWPVIATNVFDDRGSFSIANPVNPAVPRSFYFFAIAVKAGTGNRGSSPGSAAFQ